MVKDVAVPALVENEAMLILNVMASTLPPLTEVQRDIEADFLTFKDAVILALMLLNLEVKQDDSTSITVPGLVLNTARPSVAAKLLLEVGAASIHERRVGGPCEKVGSTLVLKFC